MPEPADIYQQVCFAAGKTGYRSEARHYGSWKTISAGIGF